MTTTIPTPAVSRGTSISEHLRTTEKILLDASFGIKYVRMKRKLCWRTETGVCRIAVTLDKAEVRQIDGTNEWVTADMSILV